MPSLDVFKGNGFSLAEMTDSINQAPYRAGRIGELGLFESKGIRTTSLQLERRQGKISLLTTAARGTKGQTRSRDGRALRTFTAPHIPYDATISADDVQNVRAFGTESEVETVAGVVNEVLDAMRQDHEVTHEYHKVGAIKGQVMDGDGTTSLFNLFAEFGITEKSVNFTLGTAATDIKGKVEEVRRHVETQLGAMTYQRLHCFCGDEFWDKLITHEKVVAAYDRWQDGSFLRDTQRNVPNGTGGFEFAGVVWENYRGKIGDVDFIPPADARFVPVGVPGLFLERFAPADMIDAVNTTGLPVYASQELLPHGKGVSIHTQSNPLELCSMPEVLVKGTTSN